MTSVKNQVREKKSLPFGNYIYLNSKKWYVFRKYIKTQNSRAIKTLKRT